MNDQIPRGIRNHNPGNLRRNGDPWQGLRRDQNDAEFFQFVSAKYGIRALARTLIAYQDRHAIRTVEAIIGRWAPPIENRTSAYVAHVSNRMGVLANEPLDLHDYRTLRALVEAIIRHENGRQPYPDAEIDAGLVLAGVEPPEKPLGETRTIKGAQLAAGATALGMVAEAVDKIQPALPLAQRLAEIAPWALAVLALAGIGWIVWARWDDRRRGLR